MRFERPPDSEPGNDEPAATATYAKLAPRQILFLAITTAVITANAYYIHPIIARVGQSFGVSETLIGLVPALNQVALALGVLLMMPLGDRVNNRRLIILFVIGQIVGLGIMAFAQNFWLFVAGSALLGFFTVGPYLLPAYVSKRVEMERLGRVTAVLTAGVIVGVVVARVGSGVIAQHFGWRTVYLIAIALMAATLAILPTLMTRDEPASRPERQEGYWSLVFSTFLLMKRHPDALVSGLIQAASFGIFLSMWIGIGLHLTSPAMGYGVDVVGYLAGIAIIAIVMTPRLGAWADRIGPRKARFFVAIIQFFAVSLLLISGKSLWMLMIPIIIMNFGSPAIDVTGRMTLLNKSPEIRTRLMSGYIVLMFIGAGLASWAGSFAYDHWGWTGNAILALGMSSFVLTLSWLSARAGGKSA